MADWPVILTGWPLTGGRGRSGRARALHGGWRCTEGVVDGLALHRKLLRPGPGASTGGILVQTTNTTYYTWWSD